MEAANIFDLYETICNDGIDLVNRDLIDVDAATIEIQEYLCIVIDSSKYMNVSQEKCAVLHEYAHCKTGTTYSIHSHPDSVAKHEHSANKWTVHNYLPFDDFQGALELGYTEIWELADYFDVTEDFIRKAIYIYQCDGLFPS